MEREVKQIGLRLPAQPKPKRVAAYARVSTANDMKLHSLSAQVSYYSDFIQQRPGWLYCGVFADAGLTGTKDTREGFQRLLAACRADEVDMVVTKSVSRFARNTVTLLETIREFKGLGVDVYFEEENIHTLSAEGELMTTILASYAQEESRSASENQKWRVRQAFAQGQVMNWRFLYGYRISRGSVEIEPRQAGVVRAIFQRAADGESFGSICRDLNDQGVSSPFNGRWSAMAIRRILSNEKYTGNALLQKQYRNNHLEKKLCPNRGELPRYYVEGTHPAIVEASLFAKAQEVLKGLAEKSAGCKPRIVSVFSGMIRCPRCGESYKRVTSNGSVGWNCARYQRMGKAGCSGKKIPESVLQSATAEALRLPAFDPEKVAAQLHHIEVPEPNHLLFVFKDGHTVERVWADRSRAESWTPAMREAARQRSIQQRREGK